MSKQPGGWYEAEVASARNGDDYWFILDDGERLPDPRTQSQPSGIAGPSRLVNHDEFNWRRGGTNDWTNVVTACAPCNTRKANRLPEEIGMRPLTVPVEPHFVHLSWAVRRLTPTQARYIKLFYGSETLHHLEELEHRAALRA
jgi:hypothetical protein